jgi:hypothetical protein
MPATKPDPARAHMAFSMVSALFNGQVPPIGTDISAITGLPKVQIAWQARLNGPLAQMAGQAGFGWHPVTAAQIGGCTFIENLIALVYSHLVPPLQLTEDEKAMHLHEVKSFVAALHFDPIAAGEEKGAKG